MKLLKILKKKEESAVLKDHVLEINCKQCSFEPDYGNVNCIKCISCKIFELGEPEKIILSGGLDTEYSGDAVRIINDIASVYGINDGDEKKKGRCEMCKLSPAFLTDEIFTSFQPDDIDICIHKLDNAVTENELCEICVNRTKKTLESVKNKLIKTSRDALRSAYKIMGA